MMKVIPGRLTKNNPNLAAIAAELNAADSEVSIKAFTEASLREFLSDPNRFYLIARIDGELAGATHGYVHLHPTGVKYLYVDEVDTVAKFRRQGVARAMMEETFAMGRQHGCDEVWLGADKGNDAAEALYESLKPTEIEPGTIYSWKLSS